MYITSTEINYENTSYLIAEIQWKWTSEYQVTSSHSLSILKL